MLLPLLPILELGDDLPPPAADGLGGGATSCPYVWPGEAGKRYDRDELFDRRFMILSRRKLFVSLQSFYSLLFHETSDND